jgi:hypothetical protein
MFLVPNIDQMYKEMKKIVEVGNKHGVGRSETHIFFFGLMLLLQCMIISEIQMSRLTEGFFKSPITLT